MTKKEYQKPTMKMVKIQQTQIICASLKSVLSSGLDDDDKLTLPSEEQETTGSVWDDAW